MQTDRIVMRPRSQGEAIDLGLQMARSSWPAMIRLMPILLVIPVLLAAAASLIYPPLALIVLWWLKPSLDRALLHILSNDLLGLPTGISHILGERKRWWHGGHLVSLLWYRFHTGRSAVLPVWQLEQLTGDQRRRRARALAHGDRGAASGLTIMSAGMELALMIALLVTLSVLIPESLTGGIDAFDWLLSVAEPALVWPVFAACYLIVIMMVEPFYVGAGFGLYLNQRCRLECWDLEPALSELTRRHARIPGSAT